MGKVCLKLATRYNKQNVITEYIIGNCQHFFRPEKIGCLHRKPLKKRFKSFRHCMVRQIIGEWQSFAILSGLQHRCPTM